MQISNTMPEGTSSCNIFRKIFRKHKKELRKIAKLRDFSGGGSRDRTGDLLNAIQALSQLSYTPTLPTNVIIAQDKAACQEKK